ncbi:MAG: amino acid adenylation domain-containing protein, partial [Candidatus Aminicenantes bacterium]
MNSHHLAAYIKKHARNDPQKTAIKFNETEVSYLDLERKSNQIANFFHEKVPGDPSGSRGEIFNAAVLLDRSPGIITSLIGILKAGLVFVPISPNIPAKRLELLLDETKAHWVVTSLTYYNRFEEFFKTHNEINVLLVERGLRDSGPGLPPSTFTIDVNEWQGELEFEMRYNKHCYIYFTSGSTGIPRGVLGRHKSLHHYIDWQVHEFDVDNTFQVSQFIPPTFDPYLRDIFVPLAAGGTICIPGYNTLMNPAKLIAWIDENKINLIHMVPSLFKLVSREIPGPDHFVDLKYIFLAGELLRGSDIRRFIEIFGQRIQLVNQYGPTETTLAKFFYKIKPGDINKSIIPVGKPIKGAEALILDQKKRKRLTGNSGEIYIRTPYISSGYFNKKELNKEVFIRNPFSHDKNDIVYKTGDIGRLLFDGNIELTGRVDNQVKIRGQRVEPGEIENLLLNLHHIKEAAVVDKEDKNGEKFLCAYLVPANDRPGGTKPDVAQIKSLLSKDLPGYMVPSYFITLDALPLNPNG